MQPVVGNQDVGADEFSELREYFVKRRGGGNIPIGVAVHLRRGRGDGAIRIHERVKPRHDLAVYDPRCAGSQAYIQLAGEMMRRGTGAEAAA